MNDTLIAALRTHTGGQLLLNEPMARHTTFRTGGPADILYLPTGEADIAFAINAAQAQAVPFLVIGNGSNLLVRDGGIRGLVIRLGENFSQIHATAQTLFAQAGATLAQIAQTALQNSLSGLEFAAGIPGTVGGGAVMNAGAYGGSLANMIHSVRIWQAGQIREISAAEMAYGYRTSYALQTGAIVTGATFALQPGNAEEIQASMRALAARRREKQPLNLPSAGSTFKRPDGHFAGQLIEEAHLKGVRIGGAAVSEKHAGFIVNLDNACSNDILRLIAHVQARVLATSGVLLEPEVRIVGEDAIQ